MMEEELRVRTVRATQRGSQEGLEKRWRVRSQTPEPLNRWIAQSGGETSSGEEGATREGPFPKRRKQEIYSTEGPEKGRVKKKGEKVRSEKD